MHDLTTINDIISTAVENSSYNTVLLSSCVFIIYTIIIKIIDILKDKSRNKPILEMANAIKDISSNVVRLNSVLDKTFKDAEQKDYIKCKDVIMLTFNHFKHQLIDDCINTITNNHIEENKDLIIENVNKLVNTEYYKMYSVFANYEIDNTNLSTLLNKQWIDEVVNNILTIMYNKKSKTSRMSQLKHRLCIEIGNYEIYIDNKIFSK